MYLNEPRIKQTNKQNDKNKRKKSILSEFPKTTLKYIFKNTRLLFLSQEWRQVVGNSKSMTRNNANSVKRLINNYTAKSRGISPDT